MFSQPSFICSWAAVAKKRILVVDDEPDIVSYLEMVLQDHGYETVSAGNGNEALEAVKREKPDLITLFIGGGHCADTL